MTHFNSRPGKALYKVIRFITSSKYRKKYMALKRFRRAGGEKLRSEYILKDDDIVFDLGGYRGDWTASLPNPDCQVYLFEPVKEFAEYCKERFAKRPNIHCFNIGLDATTHAGHISHEDDASSLYHKEGEVEAADFVDIEEFMDDHGIERVKLIKMNIEGGEYDILEKLIRDGRIRVFENIQIQFHDIPEIDSENRMYRIWDKLSKTHVVTWSFRPYIHENWELME